MAERRDDRLDASDIAVMVRTEDVDEKSVAAPQFVAVIRRVGCQVRRPSVAPAQDAIEIVAEFGRMQPHRAVAVVRKAAPPQILDDVVDRAALVERCLGEPAVEADAEACHVLALLLDDDVAAEEAELAAARLGIGVQPLCPIAFE